MADNRDHDADEDLTGAEEPEFDLFSDEQEDSFSDLDPDILDLSDEDVKEEIAALEREEFGLSDTSATPGIGDFDIEDGDPNDALGQVDPNELPELAAKPAKAKTGKPSKPAMGGDLLAKASAFYQQSPRLILAAVPAVLLPIAVAWFFLASDSDAERLESANSDSAVFLDPPREERLFSTTSEENSNNTLPSKASEANQTTVSATSGETQPSANSSASLPAQSDPLESGANLLAQADAEAMPDSEPASDTNSATDRETPDASSEIDTSINADAEAAAPLLAQQDPATSDLSDYVIETEPEQEAESIANAETATTDTDTATTDTDTVNENEAETAGSQEVASAENSDEEDTIAESEVTEITAPSTPETEIVAAENTLPATAGNNFYHVIAGSLPTREDADAEAERLSTNNIQAYVIPPFGSSSNFRIAVAGFQTMTAAREAIPGLRSQFGEGIWPLRYPPQPAIELITTPSNAVYVIVASLASEQAARGFLSNLDIAENTPVILAPYSPANAYRVAIASFPTLSAAQNALPQLRQRYGESAWLLRY